MSSPKVIVQIAIAGAQIFGRAFLAAGKQAVANAKHRPDGVMGGGEVAGLRNANSGSITDKLTREHRMTIDEARLILNLKKEDSVERILQHYEHMFKANSPPPPKPPAPKSHSHAGRKPPVLPAYSHYLQSKVVRAKERIEAELKDGVEPEITPTPESAEMPPNSASSSSTNPPPPGEGKSSS